MAQLLKREGISAKNMPSTVLDVFGPGVGPYARQKVTDALRAMHWYLLPQSFPRDGCLNSDAAVGVHARPLFEAGESLNSLRVQIDVLQNACKRHTQAATKVADELDTNRVTIARLTKKHGGDVAHVLELAQRNVQLQQSLEATKSRLASAKLRLSELNDRLHLTATNGQRAVFVPAASLCAMSG